MAIAPIMTPATGIYLESAKRFKGFMGSVYMSNGLIFEGKTYKFVGIFSSVLGKILKKFLVVSEQGEVVKDKDLSWRCLRIYELFLGVQRSEKVLETLSQNGMDYLEELRPYVSGIHLTLKPYINEKVNTRFIEFSRFFYQVADTNKIMHKISKDMLLPKYKQFIKGKTIEVEGEFKSFEYDYLMFNKMNCDRSIFVMESVMCRGVVKLTLNDKRKQTYLTEIEMDFAKHILEFLIGCDQAEKDTAKNIPSFKDFEHAASYLRNLPFDFTVENANKSIAKWVY